MVDETYLFPKGDSVDIFLLMWSITDLSFLDGIELLNELDNGRLALSALADEGDILSLFDFEGDIVKAESV